MSSKAALPPIVLTRGGAGDLDPMMRVMERAFDGGFGEGWSRSQCAGILPLSGVSLTMACDADGRALGFALARAVADEAELLLLAVDPDVQGRGIGQALLQGFVADGEAVGARRLHLEVRDGNGARKLYASNGFDEVGRRKSYYKGRDGSVHDAITMARTLTDDGYIS